MPVLQELDTPQINEVIVTACEKSVPAIITVPNELSWSNLHTRILAVRDAHVLLEMPPIESGKAPHEFVPAERIGISFKLRHHKHIFAGTVVGQERLPDADGVDMPVLVVVTPSRMQRLQRRAFIRVDVPPNRIVRASFWLGGFEAEPSGTSAEHPVWSGSVVNFSAGGFQLATKAKAIDGLEVGDAVGARLVFGTGGEAVFADAQVRHVDINGERADIGFQFLGLTETPDGRIALQMISAKVSEFGRGASRQN